MTAHTTLTIHPWRCDAGHVTYDRDRPTHCAHCVNGKPCTASIAALAPVRPSKALRRGARVNTAQEPQNATQSLITPTTKGAQ